MNERTVGEIWVDAVHEAGRYIGLAATSRTSFPVDDPVAHACFSCPQVNTREVVALSDEVVAARCAADLEHTLMPRSWRHSLAGAILLTTVRGIGHASAFCLRDDRFGEVQMLP
jgi:hypothetical protein